MKRWTEGEREGESCWNVSLSASTGFLRLQLRQIWMLVHLWRPPCLSSGWYLMSLPCLVVYPPIFFLHLIFLSALPQRWSLWPSCCSPVLAPILQSSTSPPQTSVVWQVRERWHSPDTPPLPLHLPLCCCPLTCALASCVPHHDSLPPPPPSSVSLTVSAPFSLRFPPLTAALFSPSHPSLSHLHLCQAAAAPFNPLICSFLPLSVFVSF